MKTYIRVATLALSALLQTQCTPASTAPSASTPSLDEQPLAQAQQSLVTVDSSNLFEVPSAGLPENRLTFSAFSNANISRNLIQTSEPFTLADAWGSRTRWASGNWAYEVDASKGQLLALKQTPNGEPAPQDEQRLANLALARLNAFGIPREEIGPILQRQLFTDEMDETGQHGSPELFNYKTFFFRAINGIRVAGHRAVVTHDLDGTSYRMLVSWPVLASSGHLLHTRLSRTQIEERALKALAEEGVTSGEAVLEWRYYPTTMSTGEVALTLQVEARVPAPPSTEGSEPLVVVVNVDPLP
ncbi:MAG TPA: hypothetical protein VNA24_18780 [Hyalangium sp.]|nr:hypothetical protein [Hyalangium sp.]